MQPLPLCFYGNKILRKKTVPVVQFDDELARFAEQMIETMYANEGVGLAAPQVGDLRRMFVIHQDIAPDEQQVFINPEIFEESEDEQKAEEGCLSIPGFQEEVSRPAVISMRACDLSGQQFVVTHAEELLARALQHELDHLDGILFIDHINIVRRKLLATKLKKLAKTYN